VYSALFGRVFQVNPKPTEHAFLFAQRFENVTIARLQLAAVQTHQTLQSALLGIHDGLLNGGRLCSFAILRKSRETNYSEPVLSGAGIVIVRSHLGGSDFSASFYQGEPKLTGIP
jgi:hypothetical protein